MTKETFKLNYGFTSIWVKNFVINYELEVGGETCDVFVHIKVKDNKVSITSFESCDYELSNELKKEIKKDLIENIKECNLNLPSTIYYDCSNDNLISKEGYLKQFEGGDWYPHHIKM